MVTNSAVSACNTIGASNYAKSERDINDFYATHPIAVERLLHGGGVTLTSNVLEPCAGNGNIACALRDMGYNVETADIIQRDFALDRVEDFLLRTDTFDGDIITNPPYKIALEFITHALDICNGHNVYMLMPTRYLEGKGRYNALYGKDLLRDVWVFYSRMPMYRGGTVVSGNAVSFAWFRFNRGEGVPQLHFLLGEK